MATRKWLLAYAQSDFSHWNTFINISYNQEKHYVFFHESKILLDKAMPTLEKPAISAQVCSRLPDGVGWQL